MSNLNPFMPYILSQDKRLGIGSLKPPCLSLQEATFICPWPSGLGNPGEPPLITLSWVFGKGETSFL